MCNISQDDKWEPLPGSKSRQLSFQASNLLPEAFGSLVANQRLKLLEVAFSPESCLTAAVNRASKSELSAKRCSLFNGYDLSTNDGIKVFREIDELKPEHVWLPPFVVLIPSCNKLISNIPNNVRNLIESDVMP